MHLLLLCSVPTTTPSGPAGFAAACGGGYHLAIAQVWRLIMAVAAKKAKAGEKVAKSAVAPKAGKVVSEVDLLIARLRRFRKGQRTGFDLREAIEDGRD
jgi:F0F1-type ATP synthase assembly protein I